MQVNDDNRESRKFEDNKNFRGYLIPFCPMPAEALHITRLLTFEQSFRCHLEQLAFDAAEPLELVPHNPRPFRCCTAAQVYAQLRAMRQQVDWLMNDLKMCQNF